MSTIRAKGRQLRKALEGAKLTGDLSLCHFVVEGERLQGLQLWIPSDADEALYRALIQPFQPFVTLTRKKPVAVRAMAPPIPPPTCGECGDVLFEGTNFDPAYCAYPEQCPICVNCLFTPEEVAEWDAVQAAQFDG